MATFTTNDRHFSSSPSHLSQPIPKAGEQIAELSLLGKNGASDLRTILAEEAERVLSVNGLSVQISDIMFTRRREHRASRHAAGPQRQFEAYSASRMLFVMFL